MGESLNRTPLYDAHVQLSGRMVDFGGWEMPVQYQGIMAEHRAVRANVGVFDVSHMSKFTFEGEGILAKLQKLVPSNLARLKPGQAQYTVLLNPDGGIIDDLIFYCHAANHWTAIANAATSQKDRAWLEQHLDGELVDNSSDYILLAIQGPEAIATLQNLSQTDLSDLKRFHHRQFQILERSGWVARTGYTGEDGVEVMVDIASGQALWHALIAAGVTACGLGCRDTLRLEAGMHLYGQDMDETTSPLEADLGWLVHLKEKEDFIGRSRLEQQLKTGVSRQLVALEMLERNIARHDYPIFCRNQSLEYEQVGIITSGTMSPSLGIAIALGYLPPRLGEQGQLVEVKIRDRYYPAQVVKRHLYSQKIVPVGI